MSQDKTQKTDGSRSFEDRVFARFDTIDDRFERVEGRLSTVEIRIGKLEERQYDTRPIWERALAMIAETNTAMIAGFAEFRSELASINVRLESIENRLDSMDTRFDSMDVRFEALSEKVDASSTALATDLENGLRGVERKIDVLNKNILDLQADQRYVDSRLEKIEAQAKPS